MIRLLHRLQARGLACRLAVLVGVALLVHAIAVPWLVVYGGRIAFQAATVAMLLCLIGGVSGLVVTDRLRDPRHALFLVSLSMLLRSGGPFIAALIIHLSGGPLDRAGLIGYIFIYYPFTLTAATVLSLPRDDRQPKPTPA